jgi:hypothetical protein
MKIFYNIRLTAMLTFALSLGVIVSCSDENSGSAAVELLSFGPSGVHHGEDISFIGNNLNKVTAIELPGIAVQSASFKEQTSQKIVLTVPQETTSGKVVLKTPSGDITSKTDLSFEVPVTISSVDAEVKPGNTLSIHGQFMNWVKEVWFAENVEASEIVSQTLEELVVKVPMEAQTGKVKLITGGTKPLIVSTEESVDITLPSVSSYSPSSIKHSEGLTINGVDLDLVQTIRFTGGASVSEGDFVSQTADQIVVLVPNTTQSGKLTLIAYSSVEVTPNPEIHIILPQATAIDPTPTPSGAQITITGTNLDLVGKVLFPAVATPVTEFVSQSETQIVLVSPEGAVKGPLKFATKLGFETLAGILFEIPGEGPAPITYAFYEDQIENNWQNWSWGGDVVLNSIDFVRTGDVAIKKTYQDWDALRFAGNADNVSVGAYTQFAFSVFGAPGTDGKEVWLIFNDNWSTASYVITVSEGEWQDITVDLPLTSIGSPAVIQNVIFQSRGNGGVVYFDHIGFR